MYLLILIFCLIFWLGYSQECGGPDHTCFEYEENRIHFYKQSRRDHDRRRYFRLTYTVLSIKVDSDAEIPLTRCVVYDRTETPQFYEQINICSNPAHIGVTVTLRARTYRENTTVYFGGGIITDVSKGEVKLAFEINQQTVNPTHTVVLKTVLTWDFPDNWLEFIMSGVNHIPSDANEAQNLFRMERTGGFIESVHIGGFMSAYVGNIQGVVMCVDDDNCAEAAVTMTLLGEPSNTKEVFFLRKWAIPTQLNLDYEWTGVTQVMKIDPVVSIADGRLVSNWLDTRVLFITLFVLVGVSMFIVAPIAVCFCCCYCTCCKCLRINCCRCLPDKTPGK